MSTSNSSQNVSQTDLVGQFSKIELPDTIEFGDRGQAQVRVINQGDITATGLIKVKLYASTDGNIDKNDILLTNKQVNLNLGSGQSASFYLNYDNITSAIAPGAYYPIAQIDSENQIAEKRENNNVVSKLVSAPNTDVVLDWNATALNAIQAEGEAGRGVPPTIGSRLLAMVSAAVHDTVQAFQNTYTPYAIDTVAPRDASLEAAVASAARNVLIALLPNQTRFINQQFSKSLQEIQDSGRSEAIGVGFGKTIAEDILELRANDGSQNNTPYQPPSGEYVWRPGTDGVAVGTNWGQVDLFAIPNVETFAPNGLNGTPTKNTSLYAREIEEVRRLGGRNNTDITQIKRTADQTEIAIFWAYDRADTFRPYGQLNQITQEIAVREGNSLEENASLFAALNIALADAAIIAWDAKYDSVQPRPDDVIAGGIAARDRFNSTVSDPNWRPLLDTPPFPDYISGHSTFGGAWAGVMARFFGENYQFTAVSQELPGVTRSFNSFDEAAFEDAISRVYGGVHVRETTVTDALPIGIEIGNYIAENLFQPTVA